MAVSIVGLDKAEVLCVLYNASKPQGMGFIQYDPTPMEKKEAQELLNTYKHFDYLKGRVMKLNLQRDDFFDEWGYDRNNGPGAAERAVTALRKTKETNPEVVASVHEESTIQSAEVTKQRVIQPTTFKDGVMTLGLSYMKNHLEPKVDEVLKSKKSSKK